MKEWFEEWFDTPFYHILYKNRDDNEAKRFIDALDAKLNFSTKGKILDLACGKGRHSIYLNSKGYDVVGVDLSDNNVSYARKFANNRLHFYPHDMREVFCPNMFGVVVNLFTSFGYFSNDGENQQAILSVAEDLKPNGLFILDYMNSNKAIRELHDYTKVEEGIEFKITKEWVDGFIYKHIRFEFEHQNFHFVEKVKTITLADFQQFFKAANLEILHTWGDYQLTPFDVETSNRLILVAKKIIK